MAGKRRSFETSESDSISDSDESSSDSGSSGSSSSDEVRKQASRQEQRVTNLTFSQVMAQDDESGPKDAYQRNGKSKSRLQHILGPGVAPKAARKAWA